MNPRIDNLRDYILNKKHHTYRRSLAELGIESINEIFAGEGIHPVRRSAEALSTMLRMEKPVILPGEKIVFTRTIDDIPAIYTSGEWDRIQKECYIHERGTVCNISPDYETTIKLGLGARKCEVEERLKHLIPDDVEGRIFFESVIICISSLQDLIGKYEVYARSIGEKDTAATLEAVKTRGATSFREALQLLRILHFSIWEASNYHNTLGQFDQYMYPYYKNDIDKGVLTPEEAFELVEEFFLTCNKDSDLYPGMQQGDNGQSMVLGGRNMDGTYLFNELSQMCLQASYELELIDPKINIRVDKDTPDEIFELG
ncbi:MAG: pyruvate formate lyase family protein, partial [Tannerella sp.]|nr:pyruvate formate lyase family protein [Tannerella sp.]